MDTAGASTLGRPSTSATAYGRGYRRGTIAPAPGAPTLLLVVVTRTRRPVTSPCARCQPAAAQVSVREDTCANGAARGAGAAITPTAPRLLTVSANAARACPRA